ncbi:unnamed protein product [Macrosiphum euphorbiae]|uniref:DUF4806 domain-containing protein n=1 Tax=Macrosiphum euphorbiae TaxID=13131 RepID=A0AAV0WFM1_9HEMI|nr:unnamed protein product [Macrosiphum euphorbiae]
MWTVVLFETDNTVNVVPNFWYSNGICQWPKKNLRTDTKNMIKRRSKPDEVTFNSYKARPLLENIVSYVEAEAKAIKAQKTDELSSNDDDKITRKLRKIKQTSPPITKKFKEKSHLPKIPVFDASVTTDDNEGSTDYDSDVDKLYKTNTKESTVPFSQSFKDNSYYDTSPENGLYNIDHQEPSTSQTAVSYGSGSKKKKTHHTSSSDQLNKNIDYTVQPIISPSSANKSADESDQAFRKCVRRSLANLKYDAEHFHKRFDAQESLLEKILAKLDSQESKGSAMVYNDYDDVDLGVIDNDEDLNNMEEKLINDKPYRNAVIILLSRFVGNTLPETIRKIMQRLFTDQFLSKYSFIGFKGKHQFSTLQCCSIIYDIVRKMKKFKDTANIDIEKPIKNWMAQATPRIKKMAEKSLQTNHDDDN